MSTLPTYHHVTTPPGMGAWVCGLCGVPVADQPVHNAWHLNLADHGHERQAA